MRTVAAALLALALSVTIECPASGETPTCKQCRDQQRACMTNYPGKTCKVEYDICIKGCKGK